MEDIRAKFQSGKVWYLPHFGVYRSKKPTQIRVVLDSSAEYSDMSINKELLPGPDLMNSLLGVLIRFRRETTAIMQICPGLNATDIQIPHDKHHKVSSLVKSYQNTHNSVKYEVI